MTPEGMAVLERYHWPGNIRELENCLERAIVLGADDMLGAEALPESVRRGRPQGAEPVELPDDGLDLEGTLDELERRYLQRALEDAGVQTKAAELLRMTFRQFRYKAQKHNLAQGRTSRAMTFPPRDTRASTDATGPALANCCAGGAKARRSGTRGRFPSGRLVSGPLEPWHERCNSRCRAPGPPAGPINHKGDVKMIMQRFHKKTWATSAASPSSS